MAVVSGKERKGNLAFMSKRRRISPTKNMKQKKNSSDSLFTPNNGETNGMTLF